MCARSTASYICIKIIEINIMSNSGNENRGIRRGEFWHLRWSVS